MRMNRLSVGGLVKTTDVTIPPNAWPSKIPILYHKDIKPSRFIGIHARNAAKRPPWNKKCVKSTQKESIAQVDKAS